MSLAHKHTRAGVIVYELLTAPLSRAHLLALLLLQNQESSKDGAPAFSFERGFTAPVQQLVTEGGVMQLVCSRTIILRFIDIALYGPLRSSVGRVRSALPVPFLSSSPLLLRGTLSDILTAAVLQPFDVINASFHLDFRRTAFPGGPLVALASCTKALYDKNGVRVFWSGFSTVAVFHLVHRILLAVQQPLLKKMMALVSGEDDDDDDDDEGIMASLIPRLFMIVNICLLYPITAVKKLQVSSCVSTVVTSASSPMFVSGGGCGSNSSFASLRMLRQHGGMFRGLMFYVAIWIVGDLARVIANRIAKMVKDEVKSRQSRIAAETESW